MQPITLPVKLRALRAAHGWTLEQAAKEIGFNADNLSKVERGYRRPRVGTLAKIADAYGVALEELLVLEEEPALAGKAEAPQAERPGKSEEQWRQIAQQVLGVDPEEIRVSGTPAQREALETAMEELVEGMMGAQKRFNERIQETARS